MYHLDLLRLYSSNESLKEKGCLEKLHKYAKWMQSASIPQNARLSIDDNVNIGKSPSMNNIIEKEWDKSVCNLPDFIPFEYKSATYESSADEFFRSLRININFSNMSFILF